MSERSTEANLWQWLRKAKPELGNTLELRRVENVLEQGTPDVEGCLSGGQFWIELKCTGSNNEGSMKLRFQPGQIPWLTRRTLAGGRAFVLVQVDKGHHARRYLIRATEQSLATISLPGITERMLCILACVAPDAPAVQFLRTAAHGENWASVT